MIAVTPEMNQGGQLMGSKGLRTRRKLIDTTVTLLASKPLRDLKVIDITQAAETSAPTFYVYFDSVIDVVLVATAELTQSTPHLLTIVNAEWTAANSHTRAIDFVDAYVAFWDAHRPLLRTRNLAAEEGDTRFIATREQSIRPLLTAMAAKIEQGKAERRIAPTIFTHASAGTLLMMLERLGALAHTYDGRGIITFDQIRLTAAHTVATMLGWPEPIPPLDAD